MKIHPTRVFLALALAAFFTAFNLVDAQSVLLVQEGFEDTAVAARGWYDSTGPIVSTSERYAGASSLECRFTQGGTACSGGTPGRHLFQASDSVYFAYYVKYSSNWVGSGNCCGPHMFYFLTNLDNSYAGPAFNPLTAYVEENAGRPILALQDGKNIDQTRINQNLTAVTESRSVAGCNGDSDGYGDGECYRLFGADYYNSKKWYPGGSGVYFDSTPGSQRYKGDWHLVEAFFQLNSIVNGKGAKDGILRYWYDGNLLMEHTNVVLRTGARATMKFNQLLVAPYMGNGSPVDQRFWVDNLVVATDRPSPPPPPPSSSSSGLPAAPTNLRIVP
jgi:hypothetical protein